MELAAEYGLDDYPSPASGCLLTDTPYSNRLRDLMAHSEQLSFGDLNLLRLGRQFRLNDNNKLIVGRNATENEGILSFRQDHHTMLEVPNVGSPISLLIGTADEASVKLAAAITARYSAARKDSIVEVVVESPRKRYTLEVAPAEDTQFSHFSLS